MYGLDPNTDLSALRGCTLTFVGFGQYQLQLALSGDSDSSISVEGDYTVSERGGPALTCTEAVSGATALLRLLGRTVESANVPENGTVRVIFDDKSVVEVHDSSAHYESYQLNLAGREIVV